MFFKSYFLPIIAALTILSAMGLIGLALFGKVDLSDGVFNKLFGIVQLALGVSLQINKSVNDEPTEEAA